VAHPPPARPDAQKKQVRAAEQDRADVAEARRAWAAEQLALDPAKLVFLDETWATTNMARRYGRAPRGERALDAVPHGRWRTTTVIAALRADGIVAPLVLEGAIDGPSFLAYVEQFVAPVLRPGQVLLMDNLSSHKVAGVREAVEAAGATLRYLPSYSPDLNPIEQVFAKLKALLRAAAARTTEALWAAVGRLLASISPAECARYFAHCGYGQSG
jgi:transposase